MEECVSLYHVAIETPLVLAPEHVQLLIVEDPHEFYRFVHALDEQIGGGEGEFCFLRENKPVSPEAEGCIVCDPFHFELNDKKVVNLLLKRLAEQCRHGGFQEQLSQIDGDVSKLFFELFSSFPFALTFDEMSVDTLLKNANVRFERTFDSLLEKTVCYINAMVSLKHCRFFVFVNLKGVLSDEDLRSLYHHCALEKISLLLLENSRCRPLLREEKAVIITEDLCEILENYGEM